MAYGPAMFLDGPRGFRDPDRVAERLGMLGAPAIQPLQYWATQLQFRRRDMVPHFDPAGGGCDARVLVVHETPGPMTGSGTSRPGSGFVSVDNDDPSAQQMWLLHNDVGLEQSECVHWNIVPWYLPEAGAKPTARDLKEGTDAMLHLLPLLPRLEVVILTGMLARRGWEKHIRPIRRDLPVIETWHPSPLSMKQPGKREQLRQALADAQLRLEVTSRPHARASAPAP